MNLRVSKMPILQVYGLAFSQGFQHGFSASSIIRENLKKLIPLDGEVWGGYSTYSIRGILNDSDKFLSLRYPQIREELIGIAQGACVSYEEILLLNILPMDWLGKFVPNDCSQIALHTASGNVYLAKTRDMSTLFEHVVLERIYPNGEKVAEVNVAGSILWPGSGMNSHGVAFSTSGVWAKRTTIDYGASDKAFVLPITYTLLQGALSAIEVVDRVNRLPRLTGLNIIVADKEKSVALEVNPDGCTEEWNKANGALIRTNHFVKTTGEMKALSPSSEEYSGSYHRFEAIKEMAAHLLPQEGIARFLSYHGERLTESVCRHSTGSMKVETVYGSIADIQNATFIVTGGNPCASKEFIEQE